jgi:hypothetical protein
VKRPRDQQADAPDDRGEAGSDATGDPLEDTPLAAAS